MSFPAPRIGQDRFPLPGARLWRTGHVLVDLGHWVIAGLVALRFFPSYELPLLWIAVLAFSYGVAGLWRYPPLQEVSELRRMFFIHLLSWVITGFLLSIPLNRALPLFPVLVGSAFTGFVIRDFLRHFLGFNAVYQFLRVQGPFHRSDVETWPYRFLKRPLDWILSLIFLLLSLPVILFAALVVFLIDRHWPLFGHLREGLHGKPFRVWKIRTMYVDSERRLFEYLRRFPELRREWEQFQKIKNDPRILPVVGRFLRKTSVDELPQFWNVLRGEMSLVGPRPLPDYHLSRYSPVIRRLRERALPGITGLWQVLVRSDGDVMMQQLLDAYYVQHWSMWLDVYILLKTFRVVITGKGAY